MRELACYLMASARAGTATLLRTATALLWARSAAFESTSPNGLALSREPHEIVFATWLGRRARLAGCSALLGSHGR